MVPYLLLDARVLKVNFNQIAKCCAGTHLRVYYFVGVNELRHEQNGRHFADNIFKCILLNEFSLKIVQLIMRKYSRGNTRAQRVSVHKIIGHVGHFRWLGPNVWWDISQIFDRTYKAHWTNVWWTMEVFWLHCRVKANFSWTMVN